MAGIFKHLVYVNGKGKSKEIDASTVESTLKKTQKEKEKPSATRSEGGKGEKWRNRERGIKFVGETTFARFAVLSAVRISRRLRQHSSRALAFSLVNMAAKRLLL